MIPIFDFCTGLGVGDTEHAMRVIGIQDHPGTDGLTGVRIGTYSPFNRRA